MTLKIIDQGRFPTSNASRYLQQLCKHFAYKVDVQFDETFGTIALIVGKATLTATDAELIVDLEVDSAEGLGRARGVIDSHLARFAFREAFQTMNWSAPEA